jgi:NAD+ synthetase
MKTILIPYRLYGAAAACLLLSIHLHPVSAQTALRLPPGVERITFVEGITEYSLPNGLRVLLFPDPSRPIITVNVTYKVGSRHEGYGEKGMAHLLEHMVFKGTPRHPNIPQEQTEHGARPNGTTSFDRTNYYETFDATEENLQSRIRGTLLMALSNKTGAIVLTTGNKSEMGTGYATLYGDMAGGFGVLKDISKMMVYRLADYRNSISKVIPQRVIERAPSAELRANQTDQDTLPPYAVLDAIMEAYVEGDLSPAEIIAQGYRANDVERVVRMVRASEYKRRQAPIGIRITPRGFGKDWRFPITNKFRHRFE